MRQYNLCLTEFRFVKNYVNSHTQLGAIFKKNHSTTIGANNKIEACIEVDPLYRSKTKHIIDLIEAGLLKIKQSQEQGIERVERTGGILMPVSEKRSDYIVNNGENDGGIIRIAPIKKRTIFTVESAFTKQFCDKIATSIKKEVNRILLTSFFSTVGMTRLYILIRN